MSDETRTAPPEEHRPDLVGDGWDPEPLMTAKQVPEVLNLPDTDPVYNLPIRRVRVSRGRVRWRPADVREFIERRTEEP